MRISDWSTDVCSSDLQITQEPAVHPGDTDIDIGGDAVRPRQVARPDRGRQTIVGVVGEADGFCLRVEGSDVAARSEHLSSEERRVGQEWVGTCRYRWSP